MNVRDRALLGTTLSTRGDAHTVTLNTLVPASVVRDAWDDDTTENRHVLTGFNLPIDPSDAGIEGVIVVESASLDPAPASEPEET